MKKNTPNLFIALQNNSTSIKEQFSFIIKKSSPSILYSHYFAQQFMPKMGIL
jgi:hypothetical protein